MLDGAKFSSSRGRRPSSRSGYASGSPACSGCCARGSRPCVRR